MKSEHKKYILDNISRKSIKEISQDLNLKERKIRKFLEREKGKSRDFKKEVRNPVKKGAIFASIVLIIILGFVAYSNSLDGKFLYDDEVLVRDNIYIKSWTNLSKIFTKDIGAGAGRKYNFYRPFQILTYTIDYSLWRLDIRGYHLTNILLHIFVALAIFWLVNILYDNWPISLFTSILFVVHPIHTEVVSYISGRSDSLGVLFILLCFIFYIKKSSSKNIGIYILVLLSYTLALLSRESSLVLPVLLLLYHYTFKKRLNPQGFLPVLIITFIYIILRVTVLKFVLPSVASASTTLLQRTPGFFVAITNYIRLLFLPFHLHMEYGGKLFNFADPKAILGAVILFSLSIYAFRKRESNRLIFFSISWFFVTLLPVSNLYPINAYMAEHWLYLPSIGFFIILAYGLSSLYKAKGLRIFTLILIVGLLTFYSSLTIRQNNYWKNPLDFFKRTLKYAPDFARVHSNLGNLYRNMDKKEEAVNFYKKALEIDPNDAGAYINLGAVYYDMDKKEEAIALYKKAIKINPDYAEVYINLGIAYDEVGKKEKAIASYKKALQINPGHVDTHNNLANIYNDIGKKEEAVALYKKAIESNPDKPHAYYNLGNLYKSIGKKEEAIELYKETIRINPNYVGAYINLGNTYYDIGKKEEAMFFYKKTIELDPNHARAHSNLGVVYNDMGKKEEAIALHERAIELDPNYTVAYSNLARVYYSLGSEYLNLGSNKEAINAYKKAIELNPDLIAAYNNLALAYFREKQYDSAIEYCDKTKEMGFTNPILLELLEPYRK